MNEPIEVLVVDDDTTVRSVIEDALSDGGFDPKAANSGEEALTLLRGNSYRALVIDISLGRDRIRGWDVARRARAAHPTLPLIYITGGSADEWAVHGVPNSVLLTKPFAPAQLVTAVSQLLNAAASTSSGAPQIPA